MNVAVTRARRHLTIVGDSSTVCHDPFLRSLVEYINAHGEVWSAEQYRSQITGNTTHRYAFAYYSIKPWTHQETLLRKHYVSYQCFPVCLPRETLLPSQKGHSLLGSKNVSEKL